MLIDSHAHLNFNAFKDDADKVIKKCLDKNIWIINVGSNFLTSKKAVRLAQNYDKGVYAAVGLHPIHIDTGLVKIKKDSQEENQNRDEAEFDYEAYKNLAKHPKVVAVGETGLDYYWKPKTKNRLEKFKQIQKEILLKQINLAQELNLPLIFHCRMAHQDLVKILKDFHDSQSSTLNYQQLNGIIHCFTGNWIEAQEYLNMELYLGFNAIIFKLNLDEIIKKTPLDRILIETDCPYLSPPDFDQKRNDPQGVRYVAQRIAQTKGVSLEKIAKTTTENVKKLFNI